MKNKDLGNMAKRRVWIAFILLILFFLSFFLFISPIFGETILTIEGPVDSLSFSVNIYTALANAGAVFSPLYFFGSSIISLDKSLLKF